jgi:hypothetical protein
MAQYKEVTNGNESSEVKSTEEVTNGNESSEVKSTEEKAKIKARKTRNGNWIYFYVKFLLRSEMLGTCPEISIWEEHIIQRAKKAAKEANKLGTRLNKALDKFKGTKIVDRKELAETQGIIRAYAELTGKPVNIDLPDDLGLCLEIAQGIESDYHQLVLKGEMVRATIFMKEPKNGNPEKSWPIISTHMVLGNLKENLKIIVNNGDKSILPSKVSVGETLALDVKPVEFFMRPSIDIARDENGKRILLERPIHFDDKGKKVTTIGSSETLPAGAEFGCTLRVRKGSPIDEAALHQLFDYGKNNGLGAWRGSGNKGSYFYNLELLKNYKEPIPEGWR